jgi:hypothetical protein
VSFFKIPTFKVRKGKYDEKKEEFDQTVYNLKEKIIIDNCYHSYYYGSFKDFHEVFVIGINSINKNECLDIEKPKHIKLIEDVDTRLFDNLESCYLFSEELVIGLDEFHKQGLKIN